MKFTKENIYKLFIQYRKTRNYTLDDLQDEILNLDDTPEKVVVPKFVAEWIELCKEKANLIDCLQGGYRHFNGCESIGKDEDWLFEGDNQDVVARAWLDGYEVEKEPLYEVVIHETDDDRLLLVTNHSGYKFELESDNEGLWKQRHTESEIKAIDERYCAFAVPVQEVK